MVGNVIATYFPEPVNFNMFRREKRQHVYHRLKVCLFVQLLVVRFLLLLLLPYPILL